jgi:AhpD family alkylhydroperoxidase
MTRFTTHTIESAPAAARPTLEGAKKALGFVPNLYANLAEAPAALEGYTSLSAIFGKTSFSATERQVVLLATSVENACEFCVAAHSLIAKAMDKVDPAVVAALREHRPIADARLEALATFTRLVVRERGWVAGEVTERFLAAGYTRQQALEVVLGVTMKTLSNYANHLTGTTVNPELASEAWTGARAA